MAKGLARTSTLPVIWNATWTTCADQKLSLGLAQPVLFARRSLLKLATLLTCDFAAQYVGSIAYLVWGVRVRIPSKSEFTQASTELQRYSSQQIFDLQEDNRYMTLHCHLRGRFLPLEGDLCHILAARKSILTQFFLKIKMRRIEEGEWMNMNERNINWYSLVRIQSKNAADALRLKTGVPDGQACGDKHANSIQWRVTVFCYKLVCGFTWMIVDTNKYFNNPRGWRTKEIITDSSFQSKASWSQLTHVMA